ncbi:MAG: serine/threonine-protein kinase [Myxococcota bacterium]
MTTKSFRSTIAQAHADIATDRDRPGDPTRPGMDVSSLPEVGDVVGGCYRLVRLLGTGAFGKVYVAERIDVPEHQVALKVMLREMYAERDPERELVILAAAGHPHMVQLKDHGMASSYVWFTMPVYEGETLSERLCRGTLGIREAYDTFLPIARSLEALHRTGLRHQDLKPENIFLAQFGGRIHPIILDLGVAAERHSRFVAGTVLYAAPEQTLALAGEAIAIDEKVDTYALAATLLVSLVGLSQFPGANAGTHEEIAAAQQVRAREPLGPDALPQLDGRSRQLVVEAFRRWLNPNVASRPGMCEMAEELDVLLEHERELCRIEQSARQQQKSRLRRAQFSVAALAAVSLGLAAVAYSKWEALRLADELHEAKALGAESFDQLESCERERRFTQSQLNRCDSSRERESEACQREVARVSKGAEQSHREQAAKVLACNTKLESCTTEAQEATASCAADRHRLVDEHAAEVERLTEAWIAELDSYRHATSLCETELSICLREDAAERCPTTDAPAGGDAGATSSGGAPQSPVLVN